jgi:hypothetical protein
MFGATATEALVTLGGVGPPRSAEESPPGSKTPQDARVHAHNNAPTPAVAHRMFVDPLFGADVGIG